MFEYTSSDRMTARKLDVVIMTWQGTCYLNRNNLNRWHFVELGPSAGASSDEEMDECYVMLG